MSNPDSTAPANSWMIRTAANRLMGPFTLEQVCRLISDGKLALQDEICAANEYWFFLHERAEVKKWLGVELPKPARRRVAGSAQGQDSLDELTQTDTGTGEPQEADLSTSAASAKSLRGMEPGAGSSQEAADITRVVTRPAPRPAVAQNTKVSEETQTGFFKNFGWLLIAGTAFMLYVVLRLTRLQ